LFGCSDRVTQLGRSRAGAMAADERAGREGVGLKNGNCDGGRRGGGERFPVWCSSRGAGTSGSSRSSVDPVRGPARTFCSHCRVRTGGQGPD
jgi:hypothetical protein